MSDDLELLRRYAAGESGSEEAFGELVRRHLNLVFSAGLRILGPDLHRAEDVSQMVFTNLARRASKIPPGTVLAGWLHRDACFKALEVLRGERRLRAREDRAMNETPPDSDFDWEQLRPELDQSLNDLPESDRIALLLRFFEGVSLTELGRRLGVSESRASRRVSNALHKLRCALRRKGITTTVSALAAVLTAQGLSAAPANLAAAITAQSLALVSASSTAAIGICSSVSIPATSTLLLAMKTKWITLVSIAVLFLGSATFIVVRQVARHESKRRAQAEIEQPIVESHLEIPRPEQLQHLQPAGPLVLQLINYAANHGGQLPPSLDAAGIDDNRFELLPVAGEVPNREGTPPKPILREKQPWTATNGKRSRVYGFSDGHTQVLSEGNTGFEP
jgi:RNA polymerase sigma factor (sigma-70 family)